MSDLASSNQFVKIIGYCDNPNTIIMTFYELGNMYDLIVKKSPINFPDEKWDTPFIASLMTETASAIAEIHKRGIYHNDVKVFFTFTHLTLSLKMYLCRKTIMAGSLHF